MTSGSPSAFLLSVAPCEGCGGGLLLWRLPGKRCVIYYLLLVAENYVTNCCGAGADFILFGTGAELFMRIRSRIIIFEDPEPNYYEVLEPNYYEDLEPNYYFCINNNNFIFRIRSRIFNNKNLGISFEDPEPDCYFVKKIIFILTMLGF